MAKKKPTPKKLKKKPSRRTLAATGSGGTVVIQAPPVVGTPAPIQNGLLHDAHGTAKVPDEFTDTLAANDLYLYNATDLTESVTATNIMQKGAALEQMGGALSAPVNGVYTWSLPDQLNAAEHATQNNTANNRLWVFAFWQRSDTYIDPDSADRQYEGVTSDIEIKPATAKRKSKAISSQDLSPHKVGHWLHYHDVDAACPLEGHKLLDNLGNPLKASRIKVYAFDVDWSFYDPLRPRDIIEVRRPVGDSLSGEEGAGFYSPHNSIIIWQRHWLTKERTVIIADKESEADVIVLDPTKPVYVTVNYRRLPRNRESVASGTFGLKVRVV